MTGSGTTTSNMYTTTYFIARAVASSTTITITYNANGGSFGTLPPNTYTGSGSTRTCTKTLASYNGCYDDMPFPYRAGYQFNGWQLNGTTYSYGDALATSSNHTLTASWTQNSGGTIYFFSSKNNSSNYWITELGKYSSMSYSTSSSNQYFF